MDLNQKTILITGGAGFIGSNLALEIEKLNPLSNIVVFDSFRGNNFLSNGNLKSLGHYKNLLNFKGTVIEGDITENEDLEALFNSFNFDIIFHLAAISDTTALEQDLVMKTNVNAYVNILDKAIKQKSTLVYASSAATYGNSPHPQIVGIESPLNVYGYSKLVMDNISKKYYNSGINIIGLRFFNVYGNLEYHKGKTASTILQFGLQFLQGKRPKLFNGSSEIYRDFVYIKDVVNCCILAANNNESGVYNVGTGIARSFEDVFHSVRTNLLSDITPKYIDNKFTKQYQFFTQADITSTQSDLGYYPKYTLEDGVKDYISEIKKIFEDEF
jgi:ADP-L-glycero-D-manno-heptose 6-epimerase